MAVSRGSPKFAPVVALKLLLQFQSVSDLGHFKLDNLIIEVTVSMDVGKDLVGLLFAALGNEPSWTFGDEPDEADLEDRWESLYNGGDAPAPVVGDVEGAEGQPRSNDRADVPCRVVDGGKSGTVLRMGELCNQQWRSTVGNCNAETDEEASGNEH